MSSYWPIFPINVQNFDWNDSHFLTTVIRLFARWMFFTHWSFGLMIKSSIEYSDGIYNKSWSLSNEIASSMSIFFVYFVIIFFIKMFFFSWQIIFFPHQNSFFLVIRQIFFLAKRDQNKWLFKRHTQIEKKTKKMKAVVQQIKKVTEGKKDVPIRQELEWTQSRLKTWSILLKNTGPNKLMVVGKKIGEKKW